MPPLCRLLMLEPAAPIAAAAGGSQMWQMSQQMPDVPSYNSSPMSSAMQPGSSPRRDIPSLNPIDATLPPVDIVQELVELFFELVYPWVPIFYKPNFTATMFSPERQLLLHGIVVIAFRFWRRAEPAVEIRDAYVKASAEQILIKTIDSCTLISTQALTLLALDALGQAPRTALVERHVYGHMRSQASMPVKGSVKRGYRGQHPADPE